MKENNTSKNNRTKNKDNENHNAEERTTDVKLTTTAPSPPNKTTVTTEKRNSYLPLLLTAPLFKQLPTNANPDRFYSPPRKSTNAAFRTRAAVLEALESLSRFSIKTGQVRAAAEASGDTRVNREAGRLCALEKLCM